MPELLAIALDYSVLDHLFRIEESTYSGRNAEALRKLRRAAESKRIAIWVSEISPVEMLHGVENLSRNPTKASIVAARDQKKKEIARVMNARTLGYPCSKLDDTYSRLDMSFRIAGDDSPLANELEQRLESVARISAGDARQLVCCAFPFDGDDVGYKPRIHWFVAEDAALVRALNEEKGGGRVPEIAFNVGSSADVVGARPDLFI